MGFVGEKNGRKFNIRCLRKSIYNLHESTSKSLF